MAISLVASASNFDAGSGTTLACSSSLNVAAKDIIVGMVGGIDNSISISTWQDTDTLNALTPFAAVTDAWFNNSIILGYRLVAEANATATFSVTLGAARDQRSIGIFQFRPGTPATDVISLESGPSSNSAAPGSGVFTSGAITPSGSDLVVVCACQTYVNLDDANREIGGSGPTGNLDISASSGMWYSLMSNPGEIIGEATGGTNPWVMDILAIAATAGAGGGSIVPVLMTQFRRRRI